MYLKADTADAPKIEILDITGTAVATLTGTKTAGLNVVRWNLRGRGGAASGQYLVRMTIGTDVQSQVLTVEQIKEMEQALNSN
ncbi:MAG: T9SS type A sorting domain-containing protein [Fimbriimonadaceae bacterium]